MTIRWPRVFIAMLSLLALATSASGEGAWTLWMMGASSPWDSVGTFSTRELCVEALHQQAQAVEKLGLKVTEDAAAGSFLGCPPRMTSAEPSNKNSPRSLARLRPIARS